MARGPSILVLSGIALGVGSAAALILAPDLTEAIRWIIRGTARLSFVLFLMAFVAAPLQTLWPKPAFARLVSVRRWLGLSFFLSHTVHAIALFSLAHHNPTLFWTLSTSDDLVTGSIPYGFLLLMALTSFDAARRWQGGWPWRWLHGVGAWVFGVSFLIAFTDRIPNAPVYILPTVALGLAVLLRVLAFWRRRITRARRLAPSCP